MVYPLSMQNNYQNKARSINYEHTKYISKWDKCKILEAGKVVTRW